MAGNYKILTKPFYGLIQSGTDARNLVPLIKKPH